MSDEYLTVLLGLPAMEVVDGSPCLASHRPHSLFKVHIVLQEGKQHFLESRSK